MSEMGFGETPWAEGAWTLPENQERRELAVRHHQAAVRVEAARKAFGAARVERRAAVLAAIGAGVSKVRVSQDSGVSRVTIDRWLSEA